MNKRIISVMLCLLILTGFTACGNSATEDSGNKITFYTIKNWYSITEGSSIWNYNKHCTDSGKIIEIVEFETAEELKNKLSTELMSGGGPDLISADCLSAAGISYEKLIEQGCFADINEIIEADTSQDKINLSDYNENALQSGVINGNRYFIPFYFMPNFYVTSQQDLEKYISADTKSLSYNDLIKINDKINEEKIDKVITLNADGYLWSYVYDNVDFLNKTYSFDVEFSKTAEKLKELKSSGNEIKEEIFNEFVISPYQIYEYCAEIEKNGETARVIGKPSINTEVLSAQACDIYFINKNSKKKQEIMEFIKFALSEKEQNNVTGAEIEKYDNTTSYYNGSYFPVNKKSFKTLMNNAKEIKYLDDTAKISNKTSEQLENMLAQISDYQFSQSTNYMTEVGSELINDYVNGKISTQKFTDSLKSKTKIYMEE